MNLWGWYFKCSFMSKMTVGFVLGILLGVVLGDESQILAPLGKLFLNLLRMIVIPLVVLSLIVAVNHSNPRELGRIGLKIFPFYLIATGVSVVVGILLANITHPGTGLSLPIGAEVHPPKHPNFIDTLVNMVPSNIFHALSSGDILAIVFVSVIVGLAILFLRHEDDIKRQEMGNLIYKIIESGNEVVTKIFAGILQYAPIGVMGITANTIGNQGIDTVIALGKFIGTSYLGVILLIAIVYPFMLKLFSVKVIKFYCDIKEAIFTSFVTNHLLLVVV